MIKFNGFEYQVKVGFALTGAVWKRLCMVAASHYDGQCKASIKQGGFLYGWGNRLTFAQEGCPTPDQIQDDWSVDVMATGDELDRCCKILEQEHHHNTSGWFILDDFERMLRSQIKETRHINSLPGHVHLMNQ